MRLNKDHLLTIIIPFLNEGDEVENTLKSIRDNSDSDIDIILINDSSDDNYQYETVAIKYKARYVFNKSRLGVAASRDLGVELCETPYFLILDAHMRFYDNYWVQRIVEELQKTEKVLLCCQTRVLRKIDGEVVIIRNRPSSYGAFLNFWDEKMFFEEEWLKDKFLIDNEIVVPSVLGATYACSKQYWTHLKGLNGLKYYGSDESYISIKVWMDGGICKFIKEVEIGHIYRDEFPYTIENKYRIYNKLFIAELLFPVNLKKRYISQLKTCRDIVYLKAYSMVLENYETIISLKKYYKTILQYDFSFFYDLNCKAVNYPRITKNPDEKLIQLAGVLKEEANKTKDVGLFRGKMGFAIFFFHYATYTEKEEYKTLSVAILESIYEEITLDLSESLASGFCGIGWGIEYLAQHGFVEGDTEEVLYEIDKRIMERDISRISDLSVETGLGGILHYVLIRSTSSMKNDKKMPFDSQYLAILHERVDKLIQSQDLFDIPCAEIALKYNHFLSYQDEYLDESLNVFDVVPYFFEPENFDVNNLSCGLDLGCAGYGMKILLENNKWR